MDRDATPATIRAAYRDRARRHHPDRHGSSASDAEVMSALNEAYRVLGDPGRRAMYDRSLADGGDVATDARWSDGPDTDADVSATEPSPRPSRLTPSGPARMPWKLMAVMAVVGSAVILVASFFNDPPSEEPPDGILRNGSCVEIEPNGDAREIACTGTAADVVVEVIVPTGGECPGGLEAHRDRLGLGTACIAVDE